MYFVTITMRGKKMGGFKLEGSSGCTDTLVSNRFIDEIMPSANGEFVKIYLYLLRALSDKNSNLSVCKIADIFNHTEKDVLRALKYWEQAGLLDLCFDSGKVLTNITLKPIITDYMTSDGTQVEIQTTSAHSHTAKVLKPESDNKTITNVIKPEPESKLPDKDTKVSSGNFEKKVYTAGEVDMLKEKEDVQVFLFMAEKFTGKTLSRTDVNSLLYIYDTLGFDSELIEYLLEYCISNGHKSMRYIEKVAVSWAEEGINTVSLARTNTDLFINSCYPVLKAFGLSGRNPSKGEKEFIVKWTNTYGFSMDIILEACNKTMNQIHNPSFNYADSILKDWKDKGIKKLTDIKSLDEEHLKAKTNEKSASSSNDKSTSDTHKSKNSFNNFKQRTYDYEELEKKLLNY